MTARRLLRRTALSVRGPLAWSAAGALLRQGGFLATPYLLSFAIDDGVVAGDVGATMLWSAALVLAAMFQFIGLCVWDYCADLADARAGVLLRTRVRRGALVSADQLGAGELLIRAGRDVGFLRTWIHGLPTWTVIALTVLVLVPGLAALDPWLLLVAAATAPCLAALGLVYPRRLEAASMRAAGSHDERAALVEQIVRAHGSIRGIGAEAEISRRHEVASAELADRTVRAGSIMARWVSLGEGVPAVATAVGILVGALAVLDGRLTVGGLVTFTGWMGTIGIAVQVGLMRWTQRVDAVVGAARLLPLLRDEEGLDDETAGTGPDGTRPGAPDRITAGALVAAAGCLPVDLDARRGTLTVVTGPVGSGKSILLEALAGLREPVSGEVVASIEGARADRAVIHLVRQRPLVSHGTVRDDLALGRASDDAVADDAAYRHALGAVGLDADLADRAEDPLDVTIGHAGESLSGGQRQRLALARSLVADPPVLLLDDVTSAADAETSSLIAGTLRAEADSRIIIAASHDPHLIAAADHVLTLESPRSEARG